MATIYELAEMCNNTYNGTSDPNQDIGAGSTLLRGLVGSNWIVLTTSNAQDALHGVNGRSWNDGYFGLAYYNTVTHEVVIANRGTDLRNAPLKNILLSDRELAGALPEPVQDDAAAFALDVMGEVTRRGWSYTSVIETGHSLGGNEAQAGMVQLVKSGLSTSVVSGVGFNSPGIGGYPVPGNPSSYNFLDLFTQGDVIHAAGFTHLGGAGSSIMLPAGPDTDQLLSNMPGGISAHPIADAEILLTVLHDFVGPAHILSPILSYIGPGPDDAGSAIGQFNWTSGSDPSSIPNPTVNTSLPQFSVDSTGNLVLTDPSTGIAATFSLSADEQSVVVTFNGGNSAFAQALHSLGAVTVPDDELGQSLAGISGNSSVNETVVENRSGGFDVSFQGSGPVDQFVVTASNPTNAFDYARPGSGQTIVETIDNGTGSPAGSIFFLGTSATQLTGGAPAAGHSDTWSDASGDEYEFVPVLGSGIGTLTINQGLFGSAGNEIVIQNFDLSTAEFAAGGYLGISLTPRLYLTPAGAAAGGSSAAPNFLAGSMQSYTVSVDAPSTSAQTVTLTLSGNAPVSDFGLVSGASVAPINSDGTFTVTIPAGDTSASFTLANTADVGSGANLQLVASIPDPNNPSSNTISSAALTQNYVEPAQDPFNAPSDSTLYYIGNATTSGGVAYAQYDSAFSGQPSSGTPIGAVANGNNYIYTAADPNQSIQGGAGNDTIFGDFGETETDGGVNVIDGNGGQDAIFVENNEKPYYWGNGITAPDGPATVRIYANSETDLATAVADANDGGSTDQQGDLIASGDGGTIVGGNGNDLIISDNTSVIVAGTGNDTIVTGANAVAAEGAWSGNFSDSGDTLNGVTWGAFFENDQLDVTGGSIGLETPAEYDGQAPAAPPAGYEGLFDAAGGILDSSDSTVFGGSGQELILLSNGNDEVNLGRGDSTVLGGMGENSISGGSGNDCIKGGGGSDYIVAGSGNDLIVGRGGDNTIFGGAGVDTIYAGGSDQNWASEEKANNYVQAGSGNTLIYGSGGDDTLLGGSGTDTINAGDGNESIVAGSGDTSINGGTGPDTLVAGSGKDTVWGSTGSTTIYGGSGTDQILGTSGTDEIYAGDGGTSQAPTSITAGSGDTTIYGGQGVDQIWGGKGSDVIYAGDGGTAEAATQVVAGSGNTTIYGGDGIDHIFGGSGTDVLYAGDGGEEGNLTYVTAGTGVTTLYGGAGASVLRDAQGGGDVLEGGSGDTALYGVGQDTLIAGSGSDYLVGGANSTYIFASNDGLDEVADSGTETLDFASLADSSDMSLSAVLDSAGAGSLAIDDGDASILLDGGLSGANIASVEFGGSQSTSLVQLMQQEAGVGNATATILAGIQGNFVFDVSNGDSVSGGVGQDTISAWGNNDVLAAGSGGGQIYAEGTNDLVTGGTANDTLDAAGAGTTLVGGSGNEVFDVNDPSQLVEAQAAASSNEIVSSVAYTLPTNVDVMTLTGTADLSATGNSDDGNIITGNSGNDTLIAGSGSDTLVSGSGVDMLVGGSGPDTFVVNNSGDVVNPMAYEGWQDTVESSVSYVLKAAVSTVDLIGSANLSATDQYGKASITGNAGNDTLIGGSGADTLIAGTGMDTFKAGTGNNTFVVNNSADVIEASSSPGSNTVESSVSYTLIQGVDTLELTGSADLEGQGNVDATNLIEGNSGDDTLIAGSGADTLVAGFGSDTLVSGSGMDVLKGGAGSTTYVFDAGFGQAEIEPGSGSGTIEFGTGITPSNLTVGLIKASSGNPALLIQDGNSAVTVDGGLTGSIGAFDFADGRQLTLAGVLTEANVTSATLAGASGSAVLDSSAGASVSGGYGDDTLVGTGASDTLVAGAGNQQLLGAGGGDVLRGGIGADTLYGGVGNDTLIGGVGNTVIYGGRGADTIALTQGGTATFYPSGTPGAEVIELPNGMSLGDFTSYQGATGDLVLQSLSGDTTAVVKGYYGGGASGKTWVIADSAGDAQLLASWVNSQHQTSSQYSAEVDELRQAFAANVTATLNQIGQQGGSIEQPGNAVATNPDYNYHFSGASTQNVTVQGGALNLATSEDDQKTYTYEQTGSYTYTTTEPVYSKVTIPGQKLFISQNDPNLQNDLQSFSGQGVTPGTDAQGDPGYWITMLPTTEYEQTGTTTQVQTVPQYTLYTQESQGFVAYNVTGDGGNDVITAAGPFVGTVVTGNGNVSVDLGMSNGQDMLGKQTYYPDNGLAPGAFIEVGSGNDAILGTGGADVIAAGSGFDSIVAGLGSTVYAPLEGASTEDIYVQGPFYGGGPLPHSTLVLPNGVTPQGLQLRLISDIARSTLPYPPGLPAPPLSDSGQALEITYGDSTVLVNFGFNGGAENNYNIAFYPPIPSIATR